MSIADKATTVSANNVTIAENEQKVYEAGQKSEYDRFWDAHQNYGNRSIYAGAFAGWRGENFNPKYKIVPAGSTVAHYMFYGFNRRNTSDSTEERFDMSPYQHMLDFSKITSQVGMFSEAVIENLYCDLSKCTNFTSLFATVNTIGVENITIKTKNVTTFASWFSNQKNITRLIFTDDSEITASISFSHSSKLSDESIQSIINALGVVTSAKTLTLHADAKAKLSESDIAEITQKGWTLA